MLFNWITELLLSQSIAKPIEYYEDASDIEGFI